jgi:hypothetical protein
MKYFRVEFYDGCGLTLSSVFATRDEAEAYRMRFVGNEESDVSTAETRLVVVDKNGAAL